MTNAEIKAALEAVLDRIDAYHAVNAEEVEWNGEIADAQMTLESVEDQLRTLANDVDI